VRLPNQPISDHRLQNAHYLTPQVVCGAQPEGDDGFAALRQLGIKTVVSVDGAQPDLQRAYANSIRYIHLPIGYDSVPNEKSQQLAKALLELEGPIYVHCHRGKHRGPAAAATACVVAGLLNNTQAISAMKVMGTGENYLGLWASARESKPERKETLKALKAQLPERVAVRALVETMVQMDELLDHLSLLQQAGWKPSAAHPDLEPAHEALKLREQFTEAQRADHFEQRSVDFKAWMKGGEQIAMKLEQQLAERKKQGYPELQAARELDATLKTLKNNCSQCHESERNNRKS
jgi:protein tyrosine phosphatase (PTP) superfamily phosphohydrolase (DUF442 family)